MTWPTPQDYRDRVGRTDPSNDVTILEPMLVAIKDHLEKETDRRFTEGSAGTVAVVDGRGDRYLRLPFDFAAISAIAVDENGDGVYETSVSPAAAWVKTVGDEGEYDPVTAGNPITGLQLLPLSSNTFGHTWPRGLANIRITGTDGFPDGPPADVFEAVLLALRHWRDAQRGGLAMAGANLAEGAISTSPASMSILNRIVRKYSRRLPGIA